MKTPELLPMEGRIAGLPGAEGIHKEGVLNFNWYRTLGKQGVHAFWAADLGWTLDSFDVNVLYFSLPAIAAAFGLSAGQSGWIATVTLVLSALGGILAGALADRLGRVRILMITVGWYSLFTFLSGVSQSYEQLLIFRALQGLGYGGEWAAGAVLLAEIANPTQRGRALGMMQSGWAVGWGLSAIAYMIVFSVASPALAWRVMFWLGILPALLILYIRRRVPEPAVYRETKQEREAGTEKAIASGAKDNPLLQIFRRDLLRYTVGASLLTTGMQGAYAVFMTWLPTFLGTARHLRVVGTGEYMLVVTLGAFAGFVSGGYLNDWLGRRWTLVVTNAFGAVAIFLYALATAGANSLLLVLGFPLGFFPSAGFSCMGSFLAELYPSRARGAGQGFTYNFGRAVGAIFPAVAGYVSTAFGFSGAIAFGSIACVIAILALLMLPETRGKVLKAVV